MAADKGLALRWQVDAPVPEVLAGDRMRLRQVLTNLLSNAIKFTSQGNVDLHVELEGTEGEQVCLRWTVRDTGPGISPENQQQLFRPYDQAVGKPQPRDSTGLGLSIAKQLVELMGGRIWVESDGTGSAFHFTASLGTVKVGSPTPWC
jgi:signal transduction histidine kinase